VPGARAGLPVLVRPGSEGVYVALSSPHTGSRHQPGADSEVFHPSPAGAGWHPHPRL